MPISDLLPYLPYVTPFLSGAFGAFVGASWNSRIRKKEVREAEKREREGLLRLVDSEIYENMRLLEGIITDPHVADKYPSQSALSTVVWDGSRITLSELLSMDQDHIFHLTRHYLMVQRIRAAIGNPDAPITAKTKREQQTRTAKNRENRLKLLSRLANLGYLDGQEVRSKGEKFIGALPDYYGAAGKELEEAPQNDQIGPTEGQ